MRNPRFTAALALGLFLAVSVIPVHAQTVVTNSGFASNRIEWGAPNVPLISTPILELGTSTSVAGATGGTAGNVIGASNATISSPGVDSTIQMALPQTLFAGVVPAEAAADSSRTGHRFDFGAAKFDDAYDFPSLGGRSLAEVAAQTRAHIRAHAKRVYTNDDISHLKQTDDKKS